VTPAGSILSSCAAAARPVLLTTLELARVIHGQPQALYARQDGDAGPEHEAAAVDVPLTVVDTAPVPAIVEAAAQPDVAVLVLALHRQPPGQHPAGYTSLEVITQVTKPVMVVPPDRPVRKHPRRALVPHDGTQAVSATLRQTTRLLTGLELVVLHVFDEATVPRFLDDDRDLARWSDKFLAGHTDGFQSRLEFGRGDPATAILAMAEGKDVDVIALGWSEDLTPQRSRVIRRVLVEAGRPVLLVPLLDIEPHNLE
jgi:hypothetical protein